MSIFKHYEGKRVLLTGHTGFKGAWMCEWLLSLGASVIGVGLAPNTTPSLFNQLRQQRRVDHYCADICDRKTIVELMTFAKPDVVVHLAAQPLVRHSYKDPVKTFETNVMGTVHVLEGIRHMGRRCEAIMVTTDKCYENMECAKPYVESDPMGGHDPYSASKGATELAIASYVRSFFNPDEFGLSHQVAVASSRAGNVIGGGDWADDRIVPDCMRAIASGEVIRVRKPDATRPWQHVLEPLGGYLKLGIELARVEDSGRRRQLCSGFNFGPNPESNRTVRVLVEKVIACWGGRWEDLSEPDAPHEANLLNLSIEKSARLLGWRPVWDFDVGVERTVEWYRRVHEDESLAREVTRAQIAEYEESYENEV
ncbi:MAG: CDP-glucose 4,6-dehydratase [Verrucomicrobiota bacterium]